jgi:hypothetical protein
MLAEFAYGGVAAGFYGAGAQALSRSRPRRVANLGAIVGLPLASQDCRWPRTRLKFGIHRAKHMVRGCGTGVISAGTRQRSPPDGTPVSESHHGRIGRRERDLGIWLSNRTPRERGTILGSVETNRPPLSSKGTDAKSGWQQWIHQPQRLWLYGILFTVHYMVGVVLGVYVGLMSLTGAILVYRDELSARIPVERLVKLHSNLLAGAAGRSVNGGGAACLTVLCLTGAFIWGPGIKNWRRSLVVSLRSNFARVHWDLHSALGFWSFPFVFIWAISGAYFAFPNLFNAVFPSDSLGLLWLADLHFGRFNWATNAIWSVVGLVPAALAYSGIFVCCRRIIFHKPSNPNL